MTKTVLVAPLDWGLGHATRCIPVIRELLRQNARVIIGASGNALSLLQGEFPDIEYLELPSYNIKFPKNGAMSLSLMLQIKRIHSAIEFEHNYLDQLIEKRKIDVVISDNRFCLFSSKVKCVYMTHQYMIKSPGNIGVLNYILHRIHLRYIKHFSECWIVDENVLNEPALELMQGAAGDLSHSFKRFVNTEYCGMLSRFYPVKTPAKKKYDMLVILSGPEPQRSMLENKIFAQLVNCGKNVLVVAGKPGVVQKKKQQTIEYVTHLETNDMSDVICASELVVCRPGYSTLMDLHVLGSKALLIPTPGQTEQEYLAGYYLKNKIFFSVSQSQLNIEKDAAIAVNYKGLKGGYQNTLLDTKISKLLS